MGTGTGRLTGATASEASTSPARPCHIRARTGLCWRSLTVTQGTCTDTMTWVRAATNAARTSLIRKRSVVQVHVAPPANTWSRTGSGP